MKQKIELAMEALKKVRDQLKSSEDFFPRESFPIISIHKLKEVFLSPDKEKVLQRFIINKFAINTLHAFTLQASKTLENPQLLAVNIAAGLHSGYGECGTMSALLIFELMKTKKFSLISRYEIDCGNNHNHGFVAVEDENGIKWALDPFFNICCPLDEYWTQKKVVSFFRGITA